MVIFYGLPVVGNILLWYSNTNIRRGPPLRYKAYDTGEGRIGVFPCLPVSGKAVSELYREKIDALQAAESRLLAQRAAAQSAAAEQVRQAEKDGAALVAAAHDAVNLLRDKGYLVSGDLVVVTQGDVMSTIGSTNTTRILTVE